MIRHVTFGYLISMMSSCSLLLRLRRYKRKPVEVGVFRRSGSLWTQISDKRVHRPPTTVSVRKLERLPFRVVSKYPQCIVRFCHKPRVSQTDERADGQNYDSQDRASIAASRGKIVQNFNTISTTVHCRTRQLTALSSSPLTLVFCQYNVHQRTHNVGYLITPSGCVKWDNAMSQRRLFDH